MGGKMFFRNGIVVLFGLMSWLYLGFWFSCFIIKKTAKSYLVLAVVVLSNLLYFSPLHAESSPVYNFNFNNGAGAGALSQPTKVATTETDGATQGSMLSQAPKPNLHLERTWGPTGGYFLYVPISKEQDGRFNGKTSYSGYNFGFKLPFNANYSVIPQFYFGQRYNYGTGEGYRSTVVGTRCDLRGDYFVNEFVAIGGGFSGFGFLDNYKGGVDGTNDTAYRERFYGGGFVGGPSLTLGIFHFALDGRLDYMPNHTSAITGNKKDIVAYGLNLNLGLRI